MRVIVGGCGYVGSAVAEQLSRRSTVDVVVIDTDPRSFDRLGSAFNGETLTGDVIDREVLEAAGIAGADALVAVTRSDNTNLMAVELATHLYDVPRTVARLFNPANESVYSRLGVAYVSATDVIAKLFLNEVRDDALRLHVLLDDPDDEVEVVDLDIAESGDGLSVAELEALGQLRITAITRDGRVLIPTGEDHLRTDDVVTAAVRTRLARRLAGVIRTGTSPASGRGASA